jgi:hypothetical protein
VITRAELAVAFSRWRSLPPGPQPGRGIGRPYYAGVYPAQELLQEVGRVTIAGARLEVQMGALWWQLDKGSVDEITARKNSISRQVANVRRLAGIRLRGDLQARVQEAAAEAESASDLRNNVVHQDWVLRGPAAMRPVAELAGLNSQGDLDVYLEEWEREARTSPDWLRVLARSLALVPGQTLDELKSVERRLAAAADRVAALVFAVASARDTGHPTGWAASA